MTPPILRAGPPPVLHDDGTMRVQGITSPTSLRARQGVPLGPDKVIPVVFVPGIMGSNLLTVPQGPGEKSEIAWRPPNGKVDGLTEAKKWEGRKPGERQRLLNPNATAVDESCQPLIGNDSERRVFMQRGWGTVHHDSYGEFLLGLHNDLNHSFEPKLWSQDLQPRTHWRSVMEADRARWDAADWPALKIEQLKTFADYQYPVYAVGYNWLQSNAQSAEYLARKIEGFIASWVKAGYSCSQVVLVTHSMGGLVCRAYARQNADKVLGVIHGVLPAVGAPAAYRRMVCGAEQWSPSNGIVENLTAETVAKIVGRTPAETQPVMAVSPGPLELLPCHLHPPGWLHVNVQTLSSPMGSTVLTLPETDPYKEIYRNTDVWYRVFDPALLDPLDRYRGSSVQAKKAAMDAIGQAEHFHRQVIGDYYHPNTYAFYGHDDKHLSFGTVRWQGQWTEYHDLPASFLRTAPPGDKPDGNVMSVIGPPKPNRRAESSSSDGPTGITFIVQHQDALGDGTVAFASGQAPSMARIKRLFRTTGYDHQGSYNDTNMRLLTRYLVCRIAQDAV